MKIRTDFVLGMVLLAGFAAAETYAADFQTKKNSHGFSLLPDSPILSNSPQPAAAKVTNKAQDSCANNTFVKLNDMFYKDSGTTNIEKKFYNEGMVRMSFSIRDNRECENPGLKGAFLVGIDQGLSGERFAVFYQSEKSKMDDLTQKTATALMACVEYGTPKVGKKLDWESLLEDQKLANMTLELRATYAKLYGAFRTDAQEQKEYADALAKEIAALRNKPNGPDMNLKDVLNGSYSTLENQQKLFRCCMAGFNSGFGYLQAQLENKSDSVDCSSAQKCKQDFAKVKDLISEACTSHKCDACEISELLNKDKDKNIDERISLGCASAGYVSALTDPEGACEKARKSRATNPNATAQNTTPMGEVKPSGSTAENVAGSGAASDSAGTGNGATSAK